ncbi:threonine ammonia-lyase [Occultella gossypii]|uniref:L-threonine dehydratase catabolic TdcB n=1 Tax=Occultella gossypii TaxID=2800820 RepID=A0ABS7S8D2_9MICO|nr:threonine ammonia-lyase [Occultella gossypii]MBZ2196605.1 threonine ammonia-lyase [Occultella gossypii]
MTVDLARIRAAAAELEGVIQRTPIQYSGALSAIAGAEVWLKCENLQTGGSFKIRGAYTRMLRLSPEQKAAGVLAASAGNHAQGVALAARMLGIPATIYMPVGAALPKLAATRGYGAEVRLHGATVGEALVEARAEAERSGREVIHPFDHEDIVTGQATIALEIAEQVPTVRTVLVPTGGGGLLAGVATALHEILGTHIEVVGVQAEGAAAYPGSISAGHPVALATMKTMADGIAIGEPGRIPLEIVRREVRQVDLVSEEDLNRAMLLLAERAKLVVEPSGAAGVADLLARPGVHEGPIVAILSGGNIDPLVLMKVLQHGMVAAGRYLQVHVRVPDTPGNLAGLLRDLAGLGANVLDVAHVRTAAGLAVDEVDIAVECETKGPEHCTDVVRALTDRGYQVR